MELALLGLWRAKFFEHAAFYGGTALRIFHSLPRFSEDIDFSCCSRTASSILPPTSNAIGGDNLPACVKYAQSVQDCPAGLPRAPMPAANAAQQQAIAAALAALDSAA